MSTALPAYIDLPEDRQEKARKALSREIGIPIETGSADAVIEQVWNALVGHPLADDEANG
jgi:hypothetical protein